MVDVCQVWCNEKYMSLAPATKMVLDIKGLLNFRVAWSQFVRNPAEFVAMLKRSGMVYKDIKTLSEFCFSSLFRGMPIKVAWIEDGTEKWYNCILHPLPKGKAPMSTTTHDKWFGIEGTVRRRTGMWHVTSNEFSTDNEYVLFDPFDDTWYGVEY